MKEEEQIERKVRQRVAAALLQAGVGEYHIGIEVLYHLPVGFVFAYEQLFVNALRLETAISPGDQVLEPVRRTSSKQLPVAKQKKKYRTHWLIRDDTAFRRKQRVDRELRGLIPKIEGSADDHRIRCKDCGRWAEDHWSFCAWCGERMKKNE